MYIIDITLRFDRVKAYITNTNVDISGYKYIPNSIDEVSELLKARFAMDISFDVYPYYRDYLVIKTQPDDINYNNTSICYIDMSTLLQDIRNRKIDELC